MALASGDPALHYPAIDPAIFTIGSFSPKWYGLTYLLGFAACYYLGVWQSKRRFPSWTESQVSDMVFYGAVGAVLGGRVGSVLFYGFDQFLQDPLYLIRIWEGGMSFHGGLLGVLAALLIFGRREGKSFFEVGDFLAPLAPIGLGLGRLGNFANTELPGRVTEGGFGFYYPCFAVRDLTLTCSGEYESVLRHPSSLYQAFAEGVVLFLLLAIFARRPRPIGVLSGIFLLGYGSLRVLTEYFRMPDAHIGYLVGDWLTMGQLLSLPMVLLGILIVGWAINRNQPHPLTSG